MIFSACPPVYTLPGTWSDPDKIARCTDTLIPHFTFNPDYTFGISIAVITILLASYGASLVCEKYLGSFFSIRLVIVIIPRIC